MTAKRQFENGGWFRVHSVILERYGQELGPIGLAIYCCLAKYANEKSQQCWPSLTTIARQVGCDRSTVQRNMPRLIELGLVSKTNQAGRVTIYTLVAIPEKTIGREPIVTETNTIGRVPIGREPTDHRQSAPRTRLSNKTNQSDLLQPKTKNGESSQSQDGDTHPDDNNLPLLDEQQQQPALDDNKAHVPELNIRLDLVRYFEEQLNKAGNPIEFESSLDRQLEAAEKLLDRLGEDKARAVIRAYCEDKWHVETKPELPYLLKTIDKWLAKAVKRAEPIEEDADADDGKRETYGMRLLGDDEPDLKEQEPASDSEEPGPDTSEDCGPKLERLSCGALF